MNVAPQDIWPGLQAVWHREGEGFTWIEKGLIEQLLTIDQRQTVELLSLIGEHHQVPSLDADHRRLVIIIPHVHCDPPPHFFCKQDIHVARGPEQWDD